LFFRLCAGQQQVNKARQPQSARAGPAIIHGAYCRNLAFSGSAVGLSKFSKFYWLIQFVQLVLARELGLCDRLNFCNRFRLATAGAGRLIKTGRPASS